MGDSEEDKKERQEKGPKRKVGRPKTASQCAKDKLRRNAERWEALALAVRHYCGPQYDSYLPPGPPGDDDKLDCICVQLDLQGALNNDDVQKILRWRQHWLVPRAKAAGRAPYFQAFEAIKALDGRPLGSGKVLAIRAPGAYPLERDVKTVTWKEARRVCLRYAGRWPLAVVPGMPTEYAGGELMVVYAIGTASVPPGRVAQAPMVPLQAAMRYRR